MADPDIYAPEPDFAIVGEIGGQLYCRRQIKRTPPVLKAVPRPGLMSGLRFQAGS